MYVLQQSWAMADITAKDSTHRRHSSTLTRARFQPLSCFRFQPSVVWIPRNLFRRSYSSWAPYVTIPKTFWRCLNATPLAAFKPIRRKMELNPNLKREWHAFPWRHTHKTSFPFPWIYFLHNSQYYQKMLLQIMELLWPRRCLLISN
jgi:hypothetical protein